jgi:hypothetical protein
MSAPAFLPGSDLATRFRRDGYVVADILGADEVAAMLAEIRHSAVLRANAVPGRVANLQFLQPQLRIAGIQGIIHDAGLLSLCRQLLGGGNIILDGASLIVAEPGCAYAQGWHRDTMQIPPGEVDESWFTEAYFHNNVQINLALQDDHCLWFVKGSHARPFTPREALWFGGDRQMSAIDGDNGLGGEMIEVRAGQAVFYNNNALHRGYGPLLEHGRATIQLGYHSDLAAPTCHFCVLNAAEYSDAYLRTLAPEVAAMLLAHRQERDKFPALARFQQRHQRFAAKEFNFPKF